jgi:hypothetical protein
MTRLAAALFFVVVTPALGAAEPAVTAPAEAALVPASPVFPKFVIENGIAEEKLSKAQLAKLEAGETLVVARPLPKGREGTHVVAAALVKAPAQEIFDVIMDCKGQPKFVPHLDTCKNTYAPGVAPQEATRYKQYQKLKFKFVFTKQIEYTNEMFAIRPYVSGWVLDKQNKGDIDDSEGYWRIIPYKEGANILFYDVYNNPGMAVPDWVQEILVKGDLPKTVEAMRDRVYALQKARAGAAQ